MEKKTFKSYIILITYLVFLVSAIVKIDLVLAYITKFFAILSPLFIGIAFAFVLNKPFIFFKKVYDKRCKRISVLLSLISVFLISISIITGIIAFLIPQLLNSLNLFYNSLGRYSEQLHSVAKNTIEFLKVNDFVANYINNFFDEIPIISSNILSSVFPRLLDATTNAITSIFNIVLGIILSAYILADEDRLRRQFLAILYSCFPNKMINKVKHLLSISNKSFNLFVIGQLTEALVLGALCFVGMVLLHFNYPLLISVIIAVTSLIPVAGVFIGAIPSIFILFIAEPIQALWFIIYIIVLQLIESNLIYPRVVGDSLGLPSLWVLLAIIVGGGLLGVIGILLSVPIVSILYQLVREYVDIKEHNYTK